jgi:flagellar hook-basal body complex protein FliE
MSAPPIIPVGAPTGADPLAARLDAATASSPAPGTPFSQWLLDGVEKVNQSLVDADSLAKSFAVDDSIPPHQVTFALEQARLNLELMMQIRARLVESYQELSRMQL